MFSVNNAGHRTLRTGDLASRHRWDRHDGHRPALWFGLRWRALVSAYLLPTLRKAIRPIYVRAGVLKEVIGHTTLPSTRSSVRFSGRPENVLFQAAVEAHHAGDIGISAGDL